MTKTEAIKEASMKAAMSKQDQVVFECTIFTPNVAAGRSGCIISKAVYDYTHASLWARRRKNIIPAATHVTDVKYTP